MKAIKVVHKHRNKCSALRTFNEGLWKTPWFFKEFYYTKNGTRVGRIICNTLDCKGEIRVFAKEIEKKFNKLGV